MQLLSSSILWLLLSISLIGIALVAKYVAGYSQRRLREGYISRVYYSTHSSMRTYKTEHISFKSGCVMRVAKRLKGDYCGKNYLK